MSSLASVRQCMYTSVPLYTSVCTIVHQPVQIQFFTLCTCTCTPAAVSAKASLPIKAKAAIGERHETWDEGSVEEIFRTLTKHFLVRWHHDDNIMMWHHYDVNMKDTKHGRLPLDGGHQEVFSFFLSKTSFINAGRAPKKFFRTLESLDFHIIEALAR